MVTGKAVFINVKNDIGVRLVDVGEGKFLAVLSGVTVEELKTLPDVSAGLEQLIQAMVHEEMRRRRDEEQQRKFKPPPDNCTSSKDGNHRWQVPTHINFASEEECMYCGARRPIVMYPLPLDLPAPTWSGNKPLEAGYYWFFGDLVDAPRPALYIVCITDIQSIVVAPFGNVLKIRPGTLQYWKPIDSPLANIDPKHD